MSYNLETVQFGYRREQRSEAAAAAATTATTTTTATEASFESFETPSNNYCNGNSGEPRR